MFMTPRGLKIRIDIPTGFTLLSRLWENDPKTDAFRVLKTSEGLESIPFFAGFHRCFHWSVLRLSILACSCWSCHRQRAWYIAYYVWRICYTWPPHYCHLVELDVRLWATYRCWPRICLGIEGVGVCGLDRRSIYRFRNFECIHPMAPNDVLQKKVGVPFTQSEINFFNAYRLHADRLGISHSIEVSEDEIQSGGWQRCLEDFASKYPEAVARFLQIMVIIQCPTRQASGTALKRSPLLLRWAER